MKDQDIKVGETYAWLCPETRIYEYVVVTKVTKRSVYYRYPIEITPPQYIYGIGLKEFLRATKLVYMVEGFEV